MVFLQAVGIGLGIGIVHSLALFLVLVLARSNAKDRENDTLALMGERNELDREKIKSLRVIAGTEDPTEAIRMSAERCLRRIGANDQEVEFLLACELPDIEEWCSTNLDDLRRSQ